MSFLKFFRGATQSDPLIPQAVRGNRRSSGLNEFMRAIAGQDTLCVLDLGCTSAINISRLTNLGQKLYTEDVLTAAWDPALKVTGEDGNASVDVARFLAENLKFRGQIFDAVLCWDVADYLPEVLVKPVIERLCASMKPGGVLLGFFHTRDAGPDAPHYRYHITANDTLTLQPTSGPGGGPQFRLQRVFNNRHIENLFREFGSLKFFLSRENVREVLVVR